jgi:hypothetical protein
MRLTVQPLARLRVHRVAGFIELQEAVSARALDKL